MGSSGVGVGWKIFDRDSGRLCSCWGLTCASSLGALRLEKSSVRSCPTSKLGFSGAGEKQRCPSGVSDMEVDFLLFPRVLIDEFMSQRARVMDGVIRVTLMSGASGLSGRFFLQPVKLRLAAPRALAQSHALHRLFDRSRPFAAGDCP